MKLSKKTFIPAMLAFMFILSVSFKTLNIQEKWVAPESADKIYNPLKNDPNAAISGKKLYKVLCLVCHGPKGKGDGMGAVGLTLKPTNLASEEVQSQSDGAIFWKIAEGRAPMASYKSSIPEIKRWQIVSYIKTLK